MRLVHGWLKFIARRVCTGDPHATLDRLLYSRHVTDLQLIMAAALVAATVILLVGLPLSIEDQIATNWPQVRDRKTDWIFVPLVLSGMAGFLAFFTPVLGVLGAVLAWAYQTGSTRLGVVDLFSCEISTLCRTAAVVESVRGQIAKFDNGPPLDPGGRRPQNRPFTSQENYFPVFESNSRDLQSLEANVVIHITEFYTYMKAARDSMRALAEIRPQRDASTSSALPDAWHDAARNIVYMLYLGLESARKAIGDLVEFQPERAERALMILISELEAYRFLRGQFTDKEDARSLRLMVRAPIYDDLVPALRATVEAGFREAKSEWEPAWLLLDQLQRRYREATTQSPPPQPPFSPNSAPGAKPAANSIGIESFARP